LQILENIKQSERIKHVETVLVKKEGVLVYVSLIISPVLNTAGEVLGASAIARDVTVRKRMEEELSLIHDELEKRFLVKIEQLEKTAEALRASEERYALALQGSNEGIWDLNPATGEVYFSPRWKSMLGYEDDEFPNHIEEWKNRIHPEDRQKVLDSRNAHLEGTIPTYEIEYRLQHKDGSYRWIHGRGACQRDPEGSPVRFVGSHYDITERKAIEEVLCESEKKYRTLFEESKDAIFILDNTRKVVDVNPAGIELSGYSKEEILSLELGKLYCNQEIRKLLWQKVQRCEFSSDHEAELKR